MNDGSAIEFTDRYGGRPPSWLRGCFGGCEAMGWTPIAFYLDPPREDEARVSTDDLSPAEIADWTAAHVAAGDHDCDGWHFIECRNCGGSGRVSWFVTVARIPRWIVKGVLLARFAMRPEISPPGWTFGQRLGNYLNAAFIADIKALIGAR